MKKQFISLALIASLGACSGGNPFDEVATEVEEPNVPDGEVIGDGEGTGITRDGIPPGTATPSPSEALFRSEARGEDGTVEQGNGFATGIAFDSETDTFTVDNLAFDGDQPYQRGTAVASLSPDPANNDIGRFQVYEGPPTAVDPRSISEDNPDGTVRQFTYRAVYGVSDNTVTQADGTEVPTTQFAIVRTGTFVDYGFGGFIYQRDRDVNLPTTGQAVFTGNSAGLRDFSNQPGLQYTTADVEVIVDFSDFNDGANVRGDGVSGTISNRQIFDLAGNNITAAVASTLGTDVTAIPNALLDVGPDVLDNNGDIVATVRSSFADGSTYEEGTFFAVVSGEADEIVGVFVLETEQQAAARSRDTGGFIVYRGASE